MEAEKAKKRQATSDPHLPTTTNNPYLDLDQGKVADGVFVHDDPSEPTMGEKLGGLGLLDGSKFRRDREHESSDPTKPPSADSVHVLLMQALHADDRTLLQHCLYTQDDKAITRSIAQLNPSNVTKLLDSLISITESRGAILAFALPWLKCLLTQHASELMSQDFSLHALNSLYQDVKFNIEDAVVADGITLEPVIPGLSAAAKAFGRIDERGDD